MIMIVCVHELDLMIGQAQLSELLELDMSKKIQLPSETQTQITSTPFKTGELVRNTHACTHIPTCLYTHTHTHTHTHGAHTLIHRIQYARQGHSYNVNSL